MNKNGGRRNEEKKTIERTKHKVEGFYGNANQIRDELNDSRP